MKNRKKEEEQNKKVKENKKLKKLLGQNCFENVVSDFEMFFQLCLKCTLKKSLIKS